MTVGGTLNQVQQPSGRRLGDRTVHPSRPVTDGPVLEMQQHDSGHQETKSSNRRVNKTAGGRGASPVDPETVVCGRGYVDFSV